MDPGDRLRWRRLQGHLPHQQHPLTNDNFGRQFFATYCDRCHAAGTRPALNTLALIQANSTAIDSSAAAGASAVNTTMPQGGATPTEAERRQLGEWLACGAR
ncbi:MAG: hypothetical protein IPF99_12895 [Deltaproteobacteria bacterium]|nr:hypothetical protein [Deltaproteobacteria bacterium]